MALSKWIDRVLRCFLLSCIFSEKEKASAIAGFSFVVCRRRGNGRIDHLHHYLLSFVRRKRSNDNTIHRSASRSPQTHCDPCNHIS